MIKPKSAASVFALAISLIPAPANSQTYGPCRFHSATLRFGGTVDETARCLLRKVRPKGSGADAQSIPTWLAQRIMQPLTFSPTQIEAYLQRSGIEIGAVTPALRAGDTPTVRYFVIHDTSSPEIATSSNSFPPNIDDPDYSGNRLTGWQDTDRRVNLIINRAGESRVLRQWGSARPLAATKLERNSTLPAARPLFVHVENIQPRLKPPGSWAWIAPNPGLSGPQEKRLAIAYVIASMHAGRWLIPAYHFNIDQGFADVHDDPQNMNLQSWVGQLETIEREILQGGSS